MAYLKKRRSTWYAAWYSNGKYIVKSTGIQVKGRKEKILALQTATAMEAAAKGEVQLTKALDAVRSTAVSMGIAKSIPTVQDYFRSYKPTGGESNQANCRRSMEKFLSFLGANQITRIDRINADICEDFCRERLKEVSFGTVKHDVAHLKTVFKSAMRNAHIDRNPFCDFSLSSLATASQRKKLKRLPFTIEEMNTIITDFPSPWKELALTSLLTGGQRLGDVCCLAWNNVDFKANFICFHTSKTGKEISVPMHPQLRAIFLQRIDNNSEYVFPEAAHKYIHWKGGMSVEFTTLLKAFKIVETNTTPTSSSRHQLSQKSFHSIRHTVVTLLRSSNVFSADVAREIVGHDSEEIERQYFTLSHDKKAQGINYLFNSIQKGVEH